MRIRIREEATAVHPNEVVVAIATREGEERLVVHRRSINQDSIEIGYPIYETSEHFLIELPRETMRGLWRVWVHRSSLSADEPERSVA